MKLVVRAWRRAVGARVGGLELRTLTVAEVEARRRSKRDGRRHAVVVADGRGAKRRITRMAEETWWARLRQRVRAVATWAVEMKGEQREWYTRSVGVPAEPQVVAVGVAQARAGGADEEEGGDGRRARAVPTVMSARDGVRVWWWMAGGMGWDASGPLSVQEGRWAKRTVAGADGEDDGNESGGGYGGDGGGGSGDSGDSSGEGGSGEFGSEGGGGGDEGVGDGGGDGNGGGDDGNGRENGGDGANDESEWWCQSCHDDSEGAVVEGEARGSGVNGAAGERCANTRRATAAEARRTRATARVGLEGEVHTTAAVRDWPQPQESVVASAAHIERAARNRRGRTRHELGESGGE